MVEPLEQEFVDCPFTAVQCAAVVGHAKVVEVAAHLPRHRLPQGGEFARMALLTKPLGEVSQDEQAECEHIVRLNDLLSVALFHPRKQRWHTHFQLREDGRIEGVTREGRAKRGSWISTRRNACSCTDC
jgi:hypothetical protein